MKLTSTLVLSVFTAVSLMGVPACDDKKGDKKDDKKDAKKKDEKKEEAKDEKKEDEAKEEAKADEGGEAPAEEGGAEGAPEDEKAEGGGEGGGGADKIGVAECDTYLEKFGACIDTKAPEATKASLQDAFKKTADLWRQTAAGPGKDTLAQTCKAALDAVKKTSAGWGCEM